MTQLLVVSAGGGVPDETRAARSIANAVGDSAEVEARALLDGQLPEAAPLVCAILPSVPDALALARRLRRAWASTFLLVWRFPGEVAEFRSRMGAAPMLGKHWSLAPFDPLRAATAAQQAVAAARQRQAFRARIAETNVQLAATQSVARGEYQRLLASEQHLANFLRYSQDAVIGFDAELRVIFWSRGAEEMFGLAPQSALGRELQQLGDGLEALRSAVVSVLAGGASRTEEIERNRGGSRTVLEAVVSPVPDGDGLIGVSVLLRDVTQRRLQQEQLSAANERLEEMVRERTRELERSHQALVQSQKLEGLGKLTGGVAHDFNNVLQVIGSNLQLAEQRLPADHSVRTLVRAALQATERGARLSAQLLAFARRQALEPIAFDINRRVREMDDLLRRSLGEQIEIETVLAAGIWTTFADPAQLENVLLNLAINARDAMPDGGKLTIETANVVLDEAYTEEMHDVPPGQYVMVAVTDTGTGMAPEVAAHAFEPFFTTKPEGQGTGLGLSMAYGFTKQSGGHIRLYSELGVGTTVKLYLPRTHQQEILPLRREQKAPGGGSETILVVEDDQAVQVAVVSTLESLGYRVLRAGDARSGLSILQSGATIDLLFTDVVMPGPVRSVELARAAKELGVAVLFTSGYTQNAIVHAGRLDPGVELLSKPYRQEQLARKVRKVLDGAKAARSRASSEPPRVVLVEDQEDLRETTKQLLELLGCRVDAAANAEEAQRVLAEPPAILITDIVLPGSSGVHLALAVNERWPGTLIVICSGYGSAAQIPASLPHLLLPKPFGIDELKNVVEAAAARSG